MEINRCPRCDAAVRPGADWCTLCYADLRAPAPAVALVAAPAAVAPAVPAPAASPDGSELVAAYEELLAFTGAPHQESAQPGLALLPTPTPTPTPAAPEPVRGWPCASCREINPFEAMVCHACTTPFGAGLSGPRPSYDRRKVLLYGIGTAAILVLLIGVFAFFGTHAEPGPVAPVPAQVTSGG